MAAELVNPSTHDVFAAPTTSDGRAVFMPAYTLEVDVALDVDAAFDLWIKGIWVQGGLSLLKPPVSLETPGVGRGRIGCTRRVLFGAVRERILDAGVPSSTTKIASVLYTVVTMPLPFLEYKALVEFEPRTVIDGSPCTRVRWRGCVAPKAWDIYGLACYVVCISFASPCRPCSRATRRTLPRPSKSQKHARCYGQLLWCNLCSVASTDPSSSRRAWARPRLLPSRRGVP
ncbi:hypothetical protein SPRG_19893 [Saprolegnia parasitica CBS 223.65]|uniref:Uncharacterized protein n=1 Tax=Saprolegnia parasitica (strain CBS 223.65) TaxID=695850 RepID=A0A067CFH7_SAPPC|nr:hypothetical protein SPRG_19893 [Saprolegnia parasitica CBS 223.65]KDO29223.1 hypothetical protein SPRG_19893 [Saprolegnia parasitica CBS 223.65]|eukprot:XP_012200120.1 hypothetical protein SPRG_19893 [Saprolegnia parasitica CBS 223.65]